MLPVSTRLSVLCHPLLVMVMVWKSRLTQANSLMPMTITLKSPVSSPPSSQADSLHLSVSDSVVRPTVLDLDSTPPRPKTPTDGHTLPRPAHLTEDPSTPSNHLCNLLHFPSVVHKSLLVPLSHYRLLDPLRSLHQEVHLDWHPPDLLLLLLLLPRLLFLRLWNPNVHRHYLVMNHSSSSIPIPPMIQA